MARPTDALKKQLLTTVQLSFGYVLPYLARGFYFWRYRFVHRMMRNIFLNPSRGFGAYLSGCLVFSDAKLSETLKHIRQTYHVEQDSSGTCGPVSDHHGHVDLSELPHAAITRRSLRCLKN